MDSFNVRRLRLLLTTIFSVMALTLFIVCGVVYYQLIQMKSIFRQTEAHIVYITPVSEYPIVEYEWGDETYQSTLRFQSSSFYDGESITIFLNPKHPTHIEVETGYWVGIFVTGGLGALFAAIGLAILIFLRSRRNRQEKLLLNGRKVEAEIEDVYYNVTMSVGGRHPYTILCSWRNPEDGINYHFRSANLWENPTPIIEKYQIKTLPVYLDKRHIRRYFISLEKITDRCGENIYL